MSEHPHDPISEPLNTWLDGFVQGRAAAPAVGGEDLTQVTAAAGAFHRLVHEGERFAAASSPMSSRWEDVMRSATIPASGPPAASQAARLRTAPGRGVAWIVPGFGDMGTMAAIIAVMLLVGAVFTNLAPRGDGLGDDLALVPGESSATPDATAEAWLTPVDASECSVIPRSGSEMATIRAEQYSMTPREYLPASPASTPDALQAANIYRTWSACVMDGSANNRRALETPRFIGEVGRFQPIPWTGYGTAQDWIDANEAMREAYLPSDPMALVRTDVTLPDATSNNVWEAVPVEVLEPQWILQLPDGRLAAPLTQFFPSNVDLASTSDSVHSLTVRVVFLAPDPTRSGTWALDEGTVLCLTNCDGFYRIAPSAPEATPLATPTPVPAGGSDSWLTPVGPEDCTVEPRPEDEAEAWLRNPPDAPTGPYLPAGPVDDAVADRVATAARMWLACDDPALYGQRWAVESPYFIGDQGMTRITTFSNFESFDEWRAFTESLQESYITGDPSDYVIVSDLVTPTEETFNTVPNLTTTAQPQHAVSLPDGRVAVPLTWLLEDDGSRLDWQEGSWMTAIVLILTTDPTQGGQWVVDELFELCIGDCGDLYYSMQEEVFSANAAVFVATPTATCTPSSWFVGTNPAPSITDPALQDVPWMEAETISGDVTVLGLQVYGAYPLPVGGVFPGNGMSADMIWVTSEYVTQLRITARLVDDPDAPLAFIDTVPEGEVNDTGMQWASVMDLPSPGCWEVTITANPVDGGEPVVARVTVLVVADAFVMGPPVVDEATAGTTGVATPVATLVG